MPYTSNKKSTQLDTLNSATVDSADLQIIGDVSDNGRAKAMTIADLTTKITNVINTTVGSNKVNATATDTTAGVLDDKIELVSADGSVTITKTLTNSGANEKISYNLRASSGAGTQIDQTPDNGTYGLLVGAVNGSNTTFTVSEGVYLTGKLTVYLNGVLQEQGATKDWVETTPTLGIFDFITAPATNDVITAEYQSEASGGGLLVSMTAAEDLTVGQTVGISNTLTNNLAARAFRVSQTVSRGVTFDIDENNANIVAPIGGDKFVQIGGNVAADTLYAQIGSVDTDTLTTTLGTALAVTADISNTSGLACVCKLDTDKFIVFYVEDASSTIIKYRVGTVSGTTITFGTAATFATGATAIVSLTADYLSADKGVIFYGANTPTDSRIIAFTVATTTATGGTPIAIGTSIDNNVVGKIKKTTTDTFVLATASGYAQMGTCVGGTTITLGTNTQFTATSLSDILNIGVLSSTLIVITVQNSVTFFGEYTAGTISGTALTFGTPLTGTQYEIGVYCDSATSFLAKTYSGSTKPITRYTVSGTTISSYGVINYLGTSTDDNFITMDNSYYVLVSSTGASFIINVKGMSNNFLGIAQSTVSKGASVNVLYSGKDTNQSGLIPGGTYRVLSTGLSLVDYNVNSDSLNEQSYVKALSTTDVII